MPRLTRTLSIERAEAEGTWQPRSDVVVERADGVGRFSATTGPFAGYERVVEEHDGNVTEVTRYRLAPGMALVPFGLFYRRALRRPGRATAPFWGPPEVIDAHAGSTLGALCAIAVVSGYLGTLLTQTITFAADEFGAATSTQGNVLAAVRAGVLVTVVLTAMADRRGRRSMLLACVATGCVAAAIGALSPNLVGVGLSQLVVRIVVSACTVLFVVIAAEEMPAGSRAYGVTLLGLSGAIGVGICLIALPLADLGDAAWRVLYLLPLLGLPIVWRMRRLLPETRRFEVAHDVVPMAGHARRFWLLAVSALLLNVFKDPASQLLNEFLRDERGFSAARISLFSIFTNLPGIVGVVVGGRLADVRGRRGIGAAAVLGGAAFTVVQMQSTGWAMWAWSIAASVIGGAAIPALGVYGPELFPTSLRGRANGVVAVLGVVGTVTGLVAAGYLSDRWDGLGPALTLLAVGPLIMGVLVLVAYPETAHRELEELNPEDRPPPVSGARPATG
ncbi:MAG: MFS transporter [Acidimicrobiales bacterium]|nr:MFS transporter [Acidimicrobiales bacterium]